MSKLVIAEKPSVAQSIASVIGSNERKDGYLEGNGWLVSWCVGHLVELMMPEDYEEKYGKWKMEDLPILPEDWKYTVSSSTKKQFRILKELMDRSDVESLVCATDAGREGELIFRLVYEQAGCRKPFKAVLNLIVARFLSAPGNPCCYTETKLELKKDDAVFISKSRTVTDPSWKALEKQILGKDAAPDKEEKQEIPADISLYEGKNLTIRNAEIKEGKTEPKKHFTEDTLLSAMEKAGSGEISEEAERQGIGTPATRAGIIEKLVQKGFIERTGNKKNKLLLATEKGSNLVSVVPDQIKSASLTADWEQKLLKVEKKEYGSEQFMQEIRGMVTNLVLDNQNPQNQDLFRKAEAKVIGKCPVRGSDVTEKRKGWFCSKSSMRSSLQRRRFWQALPQ